MYKNEHGELVMQNLSMREKIRFLREKNNLTQKELAELAGVTATAIYNWESGLTKPDRRSLQKLATALGTSVGYLIGEVPFWPRHCEIPEQERTLEQADAIRDQVYRMQDMHYEDSMSMGHYRDPELGIHKIFKDMERMIKAIEHCYQNYTECDARTLSANVDAYKEIVRVIRVTQPWENLWLFAEEPKAVKSTLSEKIRRLRKDKKLSQSDLAHMVGVTRSAVYYWESGRFQPDRSSLKKIAEAFRTTVDYLLEEIDPPVTCSSDSPSDMDSPPYATDSESQRQNEDEAQWDIYYGDPEVGIYAIIGDLKRMRESTIRYFKHYTENILNTLEAKVDSLKELMIDVCIKQPWKHHDTSKQ